MPSFNLHPKPALGTVPYSKFIIQNLPAGQAGSIFNIHHLPAWFTFLAMILVVQSGIAQDTLKVRWKSDGWGIRLNNFPMATKIKNFEDYILYAADPTDECLANVKTDDFHFYGRNIPAVEINQYFRKNYSPKSYGILQIGMAAQLRWKGVASFSYSFYYAPFDTTYSGGAYFGNRRDLAAITTRYAHYVDVKKISVYVGSGADVGYSFNNQMNYRCPDTIPPEDYYNTITPQEELDVYWVSKTVKGQPTLYARLYIPVGVEIPLWKRMRFFAQTGYQFGLEHIIDRKTFYISQLLTPTVGVRFRAQK